MEIDKFKSESDFKLVLANQYMKQINNFFGDEKKAMRFMSSIMSSVQRNPKLLECTRESLINSFMKMAELELMPSDVSQEAYVIPYNNSKKNGNTWIKVMEAQFQLGYQGLVTLAYRSGVKEISAEIVYSKDKFSYINGSITHEPDVFADDRGIPKGAYVIVKLITGGIVSKVMSAKDIMAMGERFSKSFETKDTPWKVGNDPNLWMWKKTVLKQVAKLIPKNERLNMAIAEDNKADSVIVDEKSRVGEAFMDTTKLTMGAVQKNNHVKKQDETNENTKQKETELYPEDNIPTIEYKD